jgi:hypothetical protein
VIVLAVLSILLGPLRILASSVLAGGVMWKGIDVLGTLQAEGRGDPDWESTRKRAVIGIVLSGIGIIINGIWAAIMLIEAFYE